MSVVRITLLMIVPSLVAVLIPTVAMMVDVTHLSSAALGGLVAAAIVFVVGYAVAVVMMALSDHRRVMTGVKTSHG